MVAIGITLAVIAIVVFLGPTGLAVRAILVGVVLGAVVFAAGFFGPMIFMHESGIGPIIGIFLGPAAFYVGGLGGFAWYAKRALRSSPRQRNTYFIVLVLFALSPIFLYVGPLRWWIEGWHEADVAESVATMPEDAPAGALRIWTVDNDHWINVYGASSVPKMFGEAVKAAGGTASVEAISEEAFPRMLADAVARNQLPDIIASNELRLLQHVFEASKLTNRLVPVTGGVLALGTLKSLTKLGAYIYLDSQSGEADLARQVLLQTPPSCRDNWSGTSGPTDPTLK